MKLGENDNEEKIVSIIIVTAILVSSVVTDTAYAKSKTRKNKNYKNKSVVTSAEPTVSVGDNCEAMLHDMVASIQNSDWGKYTDLMSLNYYYSGSPCSTSYIYGCVCK